MHLRAPTADDAEALTDLHLDVWDEAYADLMPPSVLAARRAGRADRVGAWRRILSATATTELLAVDDAGDGLLGFSSVGPGRDPAPGLPALELMALYVRAEVYGTGVGHALMHAAIGDAEAYLWVLDGNERAIRFYERQGFRFDGCTQEDHEGVERRMVRRADA